MIRLSHFVALSAPSQTRLPITFLTFKRVVSSTIGNHLNFIGNNDSVQQPICNAVQHSRKVSTSLHSLSHHRYKSSSSAAIATTNESHSKSLLRCQENVNTFHNRDDAPDDLIGNIPTSSSWMSQNDLLSPLSSLQYVHQTVAGALRGINDDLAIIHQGKNVVNENNLSAHSAKQKQGVTSTRPHEIDEEQMNVGHKLKLQNNHQENKNNSSQQTSNAQRSRASRTKRRNNSLMQREGQRLTEESLPSPLEKKTRALEAHITRAIKQGDSNRSMQCFAESVREDIVLRPSIYLSLIKLLTTSTATTSISSQSMQNTEPPRNSFRRRFGSSRTTSLRGNSGIHSTIGVSSSPQVVLATKVLQRYHFLSGQQSETSSIGKIQAYQMTCQALGSSQEDTRDLINVASHLMSMLRFTNVMTEPEYQRECLPTLMHSLSRQNHVYLHSCACDIYRYIREQNRRYAKQHQQVEVEQEGEEGGGNSAYAAGQVQLQEQVEEVVDANAAVNVGDPTAPPAFVPAQSFPIQTEVWCEILKNGSQNRSKQNLPFHELLNDLVDIDYRPDPEIVKICLENEAPFMNIKAIDSMLNSVERLCQQHNQITRDDDLDNVTNNQKDYSTSEYRLDIELLEKIAAGAARRGNSRVVLRIWDLMESFGYYATQNLYESAVTAFFSVRRERLDHLGFAALADMEENEYVVSRTLIQRISNQIGGSVGRIQNAHRILVDHTEGTQITTASLNCILCALGDTGLVDQAFTTFDDFAQYNIKPDDNSFSFLLKALCVDLETTNQDTSKQQNNDVISTESANDNIDDIEPFDAPAVIASIDSLFDMMTNLNIPKTHYHHHEHIRILTQLNELDLAKSVLKELIADAPEQQKVLLNFFHERFGVTNDLIRDCEIVCNRCAHSGANWNGQCIA
mmetsp:Transcript_60412/g.72620  ORF Transcript_60412/g.72620 Transcript_60412/m.72620 type:complete len:909 (+) Transcript_60412:55-2781(+)